MMTTFSIKRGKLGLGRGLGKKQGTNQKQGTNVLTFLLIAPAPHAPEKQAKENGAAGVGAERIAELVGLPGVMERVDGDIFSHEEIGHRHRHQGSLKHAPEEPSRAG